MFIKKVKFLIILIAGVLPFFAWENIPEAWKASYIVVTLCFYLDLLIFFYYYNRLAFINKIISLGLLFGYFFPIYIYVLLKDSVDQVFVSLYHQSCDFDSVIIGIATVSILYLVIFILDFVFINKSKALTIVKENTRIITTKRLSNRSIYILILLSLGVLLLFVLDAYIIKIFNIGIGAGGTTLPFKLNGLTVYLLLISFPAFFYYLIAVYFESNKIAYWLLCVSVFSLFFMLIVSTFVLYSKAPLILNAIFIMIIFYLYKVGLANDILLPNWQKGKKLVTRVVILFLIIGLVLWNYIMVVRGGTGNYGETPFEFNITSLLKNVSAIALRIQGGFVFLVSLSLEKHPLGWSNFIYLPSSGMNGIADYFTKIVVNDMTPNNTYNAGLLGNLYIIGGIPSVILGFIIFFFVTNILYFWLQKIVKTKMRYGKVLVLGFFSYTTIPLLLEGTVDKEILKLLLFCIAVFTYDALLFKIANNTKKTMPAR